MKAKSNHFKNKVDYQKFSMKNWYDRNKKAESLSNIIDIDSGHDYKQEHVGIITGFMQWLSECAPIFWLMVFWFVVFIGVIAGVELRVF